MRVLRQDRLISSSNITAEKKQNQNLKPGLMAPEMAACFEYIVYFSMSVVYDFKKAAYGKRRR
jgi:hypothetical protein